jgi:hypothetical protein
MKIDPRIAKITLEPWERDWYADNQEDVDKDAVIMYMMQPEADYDVLKADIIRSGYKNYERTLDGR